MNQTIQELKKQIALLKRKVALLKERIALNSIVVVHHSATPRDTTRVESIRRNHQKRFGGQFYNYMIDFRGTLHRNETIRKNNIRGKRRVDLCVFGDFTREVPTPEQIKTTKDFLKGREWITHKGKGSATLCPGDLERFIKVA